MSISSGTSIITDGLIFDYDMSNTQRSWKGKPTTNRAYLNNPRIDSTYSSYSATNSGTWNAKHPDAITVYNNAGTDISAYSNTGVTDWTNTYHAIWVYDDILKRPVIVMRDFDGGQWKAKSFWGMGTMSSWGLSNGSTYTISWLQWTSHLSKSTNAGIYRYSTANGYWNFWDGQSNDVATSYNTKINTWQRVYATFTVSSSADIASDLGCYMYGMYGPAGVLKITDVQIENGYGSGFSKNNTRSSTEALVDLAGNSLATTNSLVYNSDNTFNFSSSNPSTVQVPLATAFNKLEGTINVWIYPTSYDGGNGIFVNRSDTTANAVDWVWIGPYSGTFYFRLGDGSSCCSNDNSFNNYYTLVPVNTWTNLCCTWKSGGTSCVYINGSLYQSRSISSIPSTNPDTVGLFGCGHGNADSYYNGKMPVAQIYKRQLTAGEVKQNFAAYRGRYGI